ncbi:MAG: hypothetical protein J07HB67_02010 [halophilic archaeon J07HB67]|nr:MAG: hypothetical protein J07HB67_02010 [halophilic archaeon J07HB67]
MHIGGVSVALGVGSVSDRQLVVTFTLVPLYAVVTSLGLVVVERSRGDGTVWRQTQSDRLAVTAVGAGGSGVGTSLLVVSVPVGVAAYGLSLLGVVSTVVQLSGGRAS